MVIRLGYAMFVKWAVVCSGKDRGSFTLVGRSGGSELLGIGVGEALGLERVLGVGVGVGELYGVGVGVGR